MNLNEYLVGIETLLSAAPLVVSYTLTIDRKTAEMAFLSGKIDLRDGSVLDFKEFVEQTDERIAKYKYGYNYRREEIVIFRYDNALDPRARDLDSYPHHKHTQAGELIAARVMTLDDVLEEIEELIFGLGEG